MLGRDERQGAARRRHRRDAIIGRTAERGFLEETINALHERGAGGVVVLEGEAGIGKTRLIDNHIISTAFPA